MDPDYGIGYPIITMVDIIFHSVVVSHSQGCTLSPHVPSIFQLVQKDSRQHQTSPKAPWPKGLRPKQLLVQPKRLSFTTQFLGWPPWTSTNMVLFIAFLQQTFHQRLHSALRTARTRARPAVRHQNSSSPPATGPRSAGLGIHPQQYHVESMFLTRFHVEHNMT